MKLTSSTMIIIALILALGATTTVVRAQTATCVQKLIPCADFLNGTKTPSTECCSSINVTVANDRVCLCNLYNIPGLLESFGTNITQALKLTQECGASTDTSICKDLASAPTGSTTTTPTTPAGVPGNDATNKAAWSMMSTFMVVVLASALFH